MPISNGVSENGDVNKPLVENSNIEMANLDGSNDKRTRFQVNKVNADNNERSIQIAMEEDDEDREDENLLTGNDRARLNSETAHSNDTKYAKSFR